ncbi:zinc-finger domain-containing protein [Leptothrix ochracea]|uniref:zinc-finger domain-containing protein n=1 Tax=Leptothrix ochracea TaxID=735331 RepID=UPI0034E25E45
MSTSSVSADRAAASIASIEVTAADLQGPGVVFCPNPKMTQWSSHPKVFIDLSHHGEGRCPYCGTGYHLKAGEKIAGHH